MIEEKAPVGITGLDGREAGGDLSRYASPEMLRHMVLDLRQMKSFIADPLVMARAEGVWYWDVNGKRYLDGISGIFVVNVGHANPRVLEALHRQLDTICFAPPLHATNVPPSSWPTSSPRSCPATSRPSSCSPAARRPPRRPSSWCGSTTARAAIRSSTRSSASTGASTAPRWAPSRPPAPPAARPSSSPR